MIDIQESLSGEKWTIFQFLLCSSFAAGRSSHPAGQFAFDVWLRLLSCAITAVRMMWTMRLWTLHTSRLPLIEVRLTLGCRWLALTGRTCSLRRSRRSNTALHLTHQLQQTFSLSSEWYGTDRLIGLQMSNSINDQCRVYGQATPAVVDKGPQSLQEATKDLTTPKKNNPQMNMVR